MSRPNKWKQKFPTFKKVGRATHHLVKCPECLDERWLSASAITKHAGEPTCRKCSVNIRWASHKQAKQVAGQSKSTLDGTPIKECKRCGCELCPDNVSPQTYSLGKAGYHACKYCLTELRRGWRGDKNKAKNRYLRSKTENWEKWLILGAKRTAKRTGCCFDIDEAWVNESFNRQGGKCYWTNAPLLITSQANHPLKPSLDRIEGSEGYTRDNVVITALSVNIGRNENTASALEAFLSAVSAAAKHNKR